MTDYTPPPKDADRELETELIDVSAQLLKLPVGTNRPLMFDMDVLIEFIQADRANAALEARIDTAQFAQNLIRDALAVDADTRRISRFGAADEVLERFIGELEALKQGTDGFLNTSSVPDAGEDQ